MNRTLAAAVVLLFLVACGRGPVSPDHAPDSGVRGRVVLGPRCPVESAASPCPDTPWSGTVDARRGGDLVEQTTDSEGSFELRLTPGTWTLTAVVRGGGPPTAKPIAVTVRPHSFTSVTLTVDTGIR
jgi:hypothetical protein